jgi:hypothetical protein
MRRAGLCNQAGGAGCISFNWRREKSIKELVERLPVGSFGEKMDEYRRQVEGGTIKDAYRGLMQYIQGLRAHFEGKYPDYFVSGSIYQGYMDMTYFAFSPRSLKGRGLKAAVVFIHDGCRFEVWLSGCNKQVQAKYWGLFKGSRLEGCHVPPTTKGVDSIIEKVLVERPDFGDLGALTDRIEKGTLKFIGDVDNFLSDATRMG